VAAALSVVTLSGVAVWKAVSFTQSNAQAGTYVAATPEQNTPVDAGWQQEMVLLGLATTTAPAATSASDTIAMIGPMVAAQLAGRYAGIQDSGSYSQNTLDSAAQNVAGNVRASISYKTYAIAEIKTDADTSYARMLAYRADLQAALAPLLDNPNPELELFARYMESGDSSYLTQLQNAAKNYRAAIANTAAVTVPKDAVNYHRSVLNAMGQFAATVDAPSTHGEDPLASAALLRTFNTSEQDMYFAFNALAGYYSQKKS
jgi:hypothetical protein